MTEMLRKQEDEIKRVKMMKQLATMHAELEAAKRVEKENFGSVKEDQSLSTDSCSEDQLEKHFLSQMDSILDSQPSTSSLSLLKDNVPFSLCADVYYLLLCEKVMFVKCCC